MAMSTNDKRLSEFDLAAIILVLFAIGCGGSENTAGPQPPPKEIRLGYFANLTHAQAVLGVSSGEFAQAVAPSKVTTNVFNAGPSLIEALFAGAIDVGYVGPGPALNAFEKSHGEGIRVIAGAASNGVLIVAGKGSGINSLSDLAGKRIATPQAGNTQDISARHYLRAVLKQSNTDNVQPIQNAEQAAMMQRGQIDASWAPEPWGSLLVSTAGAKVIAQEKDLWPQGQFAITLVVTTPKFLKDHPDVIEKLLVVHHNWTTRLQSEPQKYEPQLEQALFELTKKRLPAGVLSSAFGTTVFTDDPLPYTFSEFAKWTFEVGVSKNPPGDLSALVDTTILSRVQLGNMSAASTVPTSQPATTHAAY